jgi:hypothetical protein
VAFKDLLGSTAPPWDNPDATGLVTRFHEPYTYSPDLTADGADGFDSGALKTVHTHEVGAPETIPPQETVRGCFALVCFAPACGLHYSWDSSRVVCARRA